MSRTKEYRGPVHRCPCCSSVLEMVDGGLRVVRRSPFCVACGHNQGSHLRGFHCIAKPAEGAGEHCGCAYFRFEPALLERLR